MSDCNHCFETLDDGSKLCFECDYRIPPPKPKPKKPKKKCPSSSRSLIVKKT
jgi:hypothetical protein